MVIDINVKGNAYSELQKINVSTKKTDTVTDNYKRTIEELDRELGLLKSEINKNKKTIDEYASSIKKTNGSISDLTKNIRKTVLVFEALNVAQNVAKKSLSDFSDLQQKTLEIAKTTGLADKALKDYTDALNHLNQTQKGMELDALYEISVIAGQLGIKGKENLLAFTESVQRIAKTSKLTAEQAGEGFAKLANSLNEPISNIERLTSTFTILASTTTANEVVLLNYVQRLAGSGKTLGLTTAQIAGIGATLNDVGLSAEVAGTAMSQVFQKILTDGRHMAQVLGLDFAQFKKEVENNPIQAVNDLLQAIGRLDKGARIQALKELKLQGSRLSSTLLKLSANTDKLTKNLKTAEQGYREANATINEFDIVTQSLASTQQQFKDQLKLTSATLGAELAPTMESVLVSLTDMLKMVSQNKDEIILATKAIGGMVIAWKSFNLIMNATPIGRILTGLTAVVALAIKVKAELADVRELADIQRKKDLEAIAKAKAYRQSDAFKNKERQEAYRSLVKQREAIQKSITAQNKLNTATKQGKNALNKRLASLNMQIKTLESVYKKEELLGRKEKKRNNEIKNIEASLKNQIPLFSSQAKHLKSQHTSIKKNSNALRERLKKEGLLRDELQKQKQLLEEQRRVREQFNNDLAQATLDPFSQKIREAVNTKKDYTLKGVTENEANKLLFAQIKKATKERLEALAKENNIKIKQLKTAKERLKIEEKANTKQIELLRDFKRTIETISSNLLFDILDGLQNGETAQSVIDSFSYSNQLNNALLSSGNPYAQALSIAGTFLGSALSSPKNEFQLKEVNIGKDNTGIADSINSLKNNVAINQLHTSNQMLTHLQNMDRNFLSIARGISGSTTYDYTGQNFNSQIKYNSIGNSLGKIMENIPIVGAISGGILRGLFGSSTSEVERAGLSFGNQTVENFIKGVDAVSYTDIKTSSSSLFGLIKSTDYTTQYGSVSQQLKDQFSNALNEGIKTLVEAGKAIGEDANRVYLTALRQSFDIGKFDFKGKSQDQIAKILSGAFSEQLGKVARATLPIIEEFKKSNEDYISALTRVASNYEEAKIKLKQIHIGVVKLADIANKTGDVYSEAVRDSLLRQETVSKRLIAYQYKAFDTLKNVNTNVNINRINATLSGIGDIIKNFRGTGDQLIKLYQNLYEAQRVLNNIRFGDNKEITQQLIDSFGTFDNLYSLQNRFYANFIDDKQKIDDLKRKLENDLGIDVPTTKKAYADLVKSANLNTQVGRDRYALLLKEADDFNTLIELQKKKTEEEKKNIGSVTNTFKNSIKSIKESINQTIRDITKTKTEGNTQNRLVQDIVDYNAVKAQLKRELSKPTDKIDNSLLSSLSSRLNTEAVAIANNQTTSSSLRDTLIGDLRTFRDALPSQEVQNVNVVNSTDSSKLDKMINILAQGVQISDKQRSLLVQLLDNSEIANT